MRKARARFLALLILGVGGLSGSVHAAGPTNEDCLSCHGDTTLKRGDGRALAFSAEAFAASIHGQAGASCTDCHADLAATTDFPHAEKLASVRCAACHDAQAAAYEKSVHAESRNAAAKAGKTSQAATCPDCHGTHDIRAMKDPAASTDIFNVPATCLRCHGNIKVYKPAPHEEGVPVHFVDSIHGKALLKSGLKVAPSCVTCHGSHEIMRLKDPKSAVSRTHLPETCGSCHAKILAEYTRGIHGQALKKGNPKAPVCVNCHSAHEVRTAEQAAWKLDVLSECGTCHAQSLRTYRDTYHGQVTALGFTRVAACADCHGAHGIFPVSDDRSTVGPALRQKTCQKCHEGANANFAKYDPHADPHDRHRNPLLHYTSVFMKTLLVFVFSFFGVHSALWFPRSWRERREAERRAAAGKSGPGEGGAR